MDKKILQSLVKELLIAVETAENNCYDPDAKSDIEVIAYYASSLERNING